MFVLDPIVVRLELTVEVFCVLLALVDDNLPHLGEHRVVLLVQS